MRIETVDEIVEEICDLAGIYNDPRCVEPAQDWSCDDSFCEFVEEGDGPHCDLAWAPTDGIYEVEHVDECFCRMNFADALVIRLRAALVNEQKLETVGLR